MTLQPIVSSEEWEAAWQAPPAGLDRAARAVREAERREPRPTRLHPALSFDRRSTLAGFGPRLRAWLRGSGLGCGSAASS
jgi:hypothetical protein